MVMALPGNGGAVCALTVTQLNALVKPMTAASQGRGWMNDFIRSPQ
jgi:hypothetical protein